MDIIETFLRVFTEFIGMGGMSPRAADAGRLVTTVLITFMALVTCALLFKLSGGSLASALICAALAVLVTIFIERLR